MYSGRSLAAKLAPPGQAWAAASRPGAWAPPASDRAAGWVLLISSAPRAPVYGWSEHQQQGQVRKLGSVARPQVSVCFIVSVKDSLESILDLAKTEGMLFKWGSGTGSNLSALREEDAILSGGGRASGPLSFMKGFDAFAGVIKSGGKTRRAAKMVILNSDH